MAVNRVALGFLNEFDCDQIKHLNLSFTGFFFSLTLSYRHRTRNSIDTFPFQRREEPSEIDALEGTTRVSVASGPSLAFLFAFTHPRTRAHDCMFSGIQVRDFSGNGRGLIFLFASPSCGGLEAAS